MTIALRTLNTAEPGFRAALAALLDRAQGLDARVEDVVREVIGAVRRRGDAALLDYTARFDRWTPASAAALEIPQALLAQAAQKIPADQRTALEQAAARVRRYHDRQKIDSWSYTEADGTLLGQQVTALDRVGLYVPGGKAAYPSSVLMNAIPAKVAGVAE
ncbi:MAG: histidinol dehydrogenase, partial [Pseudomonadota bacterium]